MWSYGGDNVYNCTDGYPHDNTDNTGDICDVHNDIYFEL